MKEEKVDFSLFAWMNQPEGVEISADQLEFNTSPNTDFWQRTHNGLRRNNGHAFLTHLWDDFSFSVQTEFFYETLFDQSGILLYIDEDNWAKASLEYMDEAYGQLGSVVTNGGWSDWATTPYPITVNSRLYYRLSRRGADFIFEHSPDGGTWQQMRLFHMLGDLSIAKVGIYACSPEDSTFKVRFTNMSVGPSKWND